MMRALVRDEADQFGGILVLPGMEIGAENIHVLGFFPPSEDPGWDVVKIAAILEEGNCRPEIYGDAKASCTEFSVADAIDVIHERGGVAIPAHIDGPSGFLEEESQTRLLKLIVSRPHLFAVEYLDDPTRAKLEKLLSARHVAAAREGHPIAWTQSSDAHFVRAFSANQGGYGKPIGTAGRRTWLRLDPEALSFEAVRSALLDPENRVRVDSTSSPRGRQGEHKPLPAGRTYVRALRLDWGNAHEETLRFNEGITALAGPPRAGKTARAQAFSVVGGTTESLCAVDPDAGTGGQGGGPSLVSADVILERRTDAGGALWWLHRESAERVYVAQVEEQGTRLRVLPGTQGTWVDVVRDGSLDRRAVRNHLFGLPAGQAQVVPAVPQGFSLDAMEDMLADPARVARFVEWHYVPDEYADEHRSLHAELRQATMHPGSLSAADLAGKLRDLLTKLQQPRKGALAALNAFYKDSDIGVVASRARGTWSRAQDREQVARQILAMPERPPDAVFDVLKSIEDTVEVKLKMAAPEGRPVPAPGSQTRMALLGLLLVTGARDLGPVVLDAPGTYFGPPDLVHSLAPLILHARDAGTQFVLAVDDTNLPFAVDAGLLMVFQRDPQDGRVGPLDEESTGSLEKEATARWALRNLDGGGSLFARRRERYAGVLGAERAEHQRNVGEGLLALKKSKGRPR
jgi:hypothetical protein